MKKLFIAAGAILLTGCVMSELEENRGTVTMVVRVEPEKTKTQMGPDATFYWQGSENIKVFETTNEGQFSAYTSADGNISSDGKVIEFPVTLDAVSSAGSFTYDAVYPASGVVGVPSSSGKVQISVPSNQTPSGWSMDGASDRLIAKSQVEPSQPSALSVRFTRPVALGKIRLVSMPVNGEIRTVTISARTKDGNELAISGTTTFNLPSASPVSDFGDVNADNSIVLDCTSSKEAAASEDYDVSDFNWDTETLANISESKKVYDGYVFTCWPFELKEGDVLTVAARVGDNLCTREVTIPAGGLPFTAGNITSFGVNMSSANVQEVVDTYYTRWMSGENISIGGVDYNRASCGGGSLLADGASITAPGVYFLDGSATIGSEISGDGLIVIGNKFGTRPPLTVNTAKLKTTGSESTLSFLNVTISNHVSAPAFIVESSSDTYKLSQVAFEDCKIESGVVLDNSFSGLSIGSASFIGNDIALCIEDIQSNRVNGLLRSASVAMSLGSFKFNGNKVYPMYGTVSRLGFNKNAVTSNPCTVGSVEVCDNVFIDVVPEGTAFANWSNDYKLTVTGNIVDIDGSLDDALSMDKESIENVLYFARRTDGSSFSESNVTAFGNAVYVKEPRQHAVLAVKRQVAYKNPEKYQICVTRSPMVTSRDYSSETFVVKSGALYAEVAGSNGRSYYGTVDGSTLNIHHAPSASSVSSITVYGTPGTEPQTANAASGSVSFGGSAYEINYPDAVSDPLSGYTLQWADEFSLDDVDWQAWHKRTTYADYYCDPKNPDLVKVSDGYLSLGTMTTTVKGVGYWPTGSPTYGYTTGGIETSNLTAFNMGNGVTGRVDVRAKIGCISGSGFWEAIWMLAEPSIAGTHERGGEIDIMEHLNKSGYEDILYYTLHSEYTVGNKIAKSTTNPVRTFQASVKKSGNINDQWHVYSVEVSGGTVNFYLDGTLLSRSDTWYLEPGTLLNYDYHWDRNQDSKDMNTESAWTATYTNNESNSFYYFPFNYWDYNMILTAQVGGTWNGDPDGTTEYPLGTKQFQIDYVRYYTK